MKDPKNIYSFILEQWDYLPGLAVALAVGTSASFSLVSLILSSSPFNYLTDRLWYLQIGVALFVCTGLTLYWFYSRRYPKSSKNKVAILVAIRDDSDITAKIKKEIIEKLNDLIQQTNSGSLLEVISLRNFQAKKISNQEGAIYVSNKTRSPFVIHGRIVNLGGRVEFNLAFTVRHIPLDGDRKLAIEKSFAEAMVNRNWEFLESESIKGIKVTSQNIREISLYILGVAALQSYDFITSIKLHEELAALFKIDRIKNKSLSPLRSRLPSWLSKAYTALGLHNYYVRNDLDQAIACCSAAIRLDGTNEAAILNLASYVFLAGNFTEALRLIKILQKRNSRGCARDGGWKYSYAFLLFYEHKFALGLRTYRKAFEHTITTRLSYDLMLKFFNDYIDAHPNEFQFSFALAHVLMQTEGNCALALLPLENFLIRGGNNSAYKELVPLAIQYLDTVYGILKIPLSDRIAYP